MSTEFAISADARLHEAINRESYYQQRCEALAQHLINRDRAHAELKAEKDELEVDLTAKIAGLEDQLRLSRNAEEINSNGE